jgi:hypothetical protein
MRSGAGKYVGTYFSVNVNGKEDVVLYLTEIVSFLKVEIQFQCSGGSNVFCLMDVKYYERKKNTPGHLKIFDESVFLFDPKKKSGDSHDRIIPVSRIACRYCIADSGIAFELDRKLRL